MKVLARFMGALALLAVLLIGRYEGKAEADRWWNRNIVDYLPQMRAPQPPPAPYLDVALLLGDDTSGRNLDAGSRVGIRAYKGVYGKWTVKDIYFDPTNYIMSGTCPVKP